MTLLDSTSTTDQYAQAVRAACDDLPPGTRDELLEDLDEHLADVAADLGEGETLADRLGEAEAYAADLRQSAGYPLAAVNRSGRRRGRFALRARSLWDQSEAHPQGRVVRDYLNDLRPAWWLARAYLGVAGLAAITSSDGLNVIPHLFGSSAVGLVAVVALAWWSVRLGRATQPDQEPDRRRRRAAVWCNVVAGICLLVVLAQVDDHHTVYESYPPAGGDGYQPGVLTSAQGDPIHNIYAFSTDGKPIDAVLLYDDQGRPINAVEVWDEETGKALTPTFPKTRDGVEVQNRYPTDFTEQGPYGPRSAGPGRPNLAVPVLTPPKAAATTTTKPATTTTTKAAPTTTTVPPTTTTTAKPGG
jgi:hypothetical protein